MKTSLLNLAFAALLVAPAFAQSSLFWDPSTGGTGTGPGTWSAGVGGWATGSPWPSAPRTAQTWTDGDIANLRRPGAAGSGQLTLFGAVEASQLNILTSSYTIQSFDAADSLRVTGPVVMTAGTTLALNGTAANGDTTTLRFDSGVSISGVGAATLNVNKTFGGDPSDVTNFLITTGGDVTANTSFAANNDGLVGYVGSTGVAKISGSVTNNSTVATTFLGANPSQSLSVASVIGGTNTLAIQVGSSTHTGTVDWDGGTTTKAVNVEGGTFLVSTTLGSTAVEVQSGATLQLGDSGVLANNMNLKLSGGTFNTDGFSESLGTLTLTQNSVIDLGSGATNLSFAASNLSTWTGNLEIWNWTPGVDHIYFGTDEYGLSGMTIAVTPASPGPATGPITGYIYAWNPVVGYTDKIKFYTGNPSLGSGGVTNNGAGFGLGWAGEIVPVPEPSAVLSSLLLVFAIGWRERGLFARRRPAVA